MSEPTASATRGTVIQVPGVTPGLIHSEARQWPFDMANIWQSPVAPSINQIVEFQIDANGTVSSVRVVENQQVARERVEALKGVAGDRGREAANFAKIGFSALVSRMGLPMLIGASLLVVGWFFMSTLMVGPLNDWSFWDLSSSSIADALKARTGSHAILALLGVLCVAAPFAAPFWRHRLAPLLNAAPLVFVVLTVVRVQWGVSGAVREAASAYGANLSPQLLQRTIETISAQLADAFVVKPGAYVVVAASIYLAVNGILRWRAKNVPTPQNPA